MLKTLFKEWSTPVHDCIEKHKTGLDTYTPLHPLKMRLAEQVPSLKARLMSEYPNEEVYVGVRAVFAKNARGLTTEEITDYKIITRRTSTEVIRKVSIVRADLAYAYA